LYSRHLDPRPSAGLTAGLLRRRASDAHLPNQFRCQTSNRLAFSPAARPGAVKTLRHSQKTTMPFCFLIGVTLQSGGDQETANEFWWS